MYKLSICMMVKNEENNIRRCLNSISSITEVIDTELIIIDTGSTDNTVMICKEYTKKVFHHAWEDNFSEMRNKTLEYATGQWILVIDADEELVETKELVNFLLKEQPPNINGAAFYLRNLSDLEGKTYNAELITPRLFRNGIGFKYTGSVHNMPVINGEIQFINVLMNHYGYISSDKELMEKKYIRTKKMLIKELDKDPENPYYLYQLATTYAMHGDNAESYIESARAYKVVSKSVDMIKDHIYILSAFAKDSINSGRYEEAIDLSLKGLELEPDYVDLYFFTATAYARLGKNEEAIDYYLKYLKYLESFNDSKIKYNASVQHYTLHRYNEAYCNLSILYVKNENYIAAYEYGSKIIENEDIETVYYDSVYRSYITALAKLSKNEEILRLMIKDPNYNLIAIDVAESELKNKNEDETRKFYKLFSILDTNYGILSRVRLMILENDISNFNWAAIYNVDYNENEPYMYELIYQAFCEKVELSDLFFGFTEKLAMEILTTLDEEYLDFRNIIEIYTETKLEEDLKNLNLMRMLNKYLMFKDKSKDNYEFSIARYLKVAERFIRMKYTKEYIEVSMWNNGQTAEESYLLKLVSILDKKISKEEIGYLKELTLKLPEMIDVTKYVLETVYGSVSDDVRTDEDNKISKLKIDFITQIQVLRDSGENEAALKLIDEYISIFPNDLEMLLLKSDLLVNNLQS